MSLEEPTVKLLLIGPSSSGKTALLLRYCDDVFDAEASATIGVDFRVKKLSVKGKPTRLLIFDTAGQERFSTLTSSYYRNAQGVLLVYDTSNRESFLNMEHWFGEAQTYAALGVVKCLVGSKVDKAAARAVKQEEGQALAKRYAASFFEVSAKKGDNIRMPFVDTVDRIMDNPELMQPKLTAWRGDAVPVDDGGSMEFGSCSC